MGAVVYRADGAPSHAGAVDSGFDAGSLPEYFHVEFHETGRAACFWIDLHEDRHSAHLSAQERMEKLVTQALIPVIDALEETGEINGN